MKILISLFIIANTLHPILPSITCASELPKGRCYIMDSDSGPCSIEINGTKYEINIKGKITYIGPNGDDKTFQATLPEFFYVEAVRAYNYDQDIIFLLEITNDDSGSTIVIRYNPLSSKLYWSTEFGAFNPSPPLVDAGSVYIGGIGTVAKIDLNTGHYVWRHSGLYGGNTTAFNSFQKPIKRDDIVVFQEEKASTSKYQGVREIWVNDNNGEIVHK